MIALVGVVCFLSGFGVAALFAARVYERGYRDGVLFTRTPHILAVAAKDRPDAKVIRLADLRAAHSEVAE